MEENKKNAAQKEAMDMYNPETNTLDIRSNGLYPSNVLSNLCSNGFRFDGMVCGSMEGFLQSLKREDRDKQRQICSMKGGNARKMSVTSWQTNQMLWWKGRVINRQSEEYQLLVRQAYTAMFEQSERFRVALMQTRGMNLSHTTGEENPYKTILTPAELCAILTEIREQYDSLIRQHSQHPVVREVYTKLFERSIGPEFAISPAVLIDKKLIMRTDVGVWYMKETAEYIPTHVRGLQLDAIYEVDNGKFEMKLSVLPTEDYSEDLIVGTDFSGEFYVAFYAEDRRGNRQLIGGYDYIIK